MVLLRRPQILPGDGMKRCQAGIRKLHFDANSQTAAAVGAHAAQALEVAAANGTGEEPLEHLLAKGSQGRLREESVSLCRQVTRRAVHRLSQAVDLGRVER